jgi:hypothetical protein
LELRKSLLLSHALLNALHHDLASLIDEPVALVAAGNEKPIIAGPMESIDLRFFLK